MPAGAQQELGRWGGDARGSGKRRRGDPRHRDGVSHCFCALRCPGLSLYVSPVIPVYNAVVFLFVLANFSMATFMDPGIFPRGESVSAWEVSRVELPPSAFPPR